MKEAAFRIAIGCFALVMLAVALLIPGVAFYKFIGGASLLACGAILGSYALAWAVLAFLLVRFRERSATWGILFSVCFYGLLYWSWSL